MSKSSFKINEKYLFARTQELVRINSTNPSLSLDGKGEAEIAAYLEKQLNDLGLDVVRRTPKDFNFEPDKTAMCAAGMHLGRLGDNGGISTKLLHKRLCADTGVFLVSDKGQDQVTT